jgi:hypothetical protein
MNKKHDVIDLDTGLHYLEDVNTMPTADQLNDRIMSGVATYVYIDYDRPVPKLRIDVNITPYEGIIVRDNSLVLDHEVVRNLFVGTDDEKIEVSNYHLSEIGNPIALDAMEYDYLADIHTYLNRNWFLLHGDPNYYFVVKLEAEWGVADTDNDRGIDYALNPIYSHLRTSAVSLDQVDQTLWAKSFSKRYDYISGSTIQISDEFIFECDVPTFVGFNLCHADDTTLDFVTNPIANYANFWKRITVTRKLKTNWFHRFEIPASDSDGISMKSGFIPGGLNEGLPFIGFYDCFVSCKVKEEWTAGANDANCGIMQTLDVQGLGDSKIQIARSGVNVKVTPPNVDAWMNRHLGGSAKVFVSDAIIANRRILYEVNLPNGSIKQLVGGYMHLQYRGANEGLVRI